MARFALWPMAYGSLRSMAYGMAYGSLRSMAYGLWQERPCHRVSVANEPSAIRYLTLTNFCNE